MAVTVSYDHEYIYPYDDRGVRCPMLQVQLVNPVEPTKAVEVDVYVDSGTGRSLFDGRIAPAIGLQLTGGRLQQYSSAAGYAINGWLHRIIIAHPDLGSFQLEVGFSDQEIKRNLLGRDFFTLVQIGFREKHSTFYVTARP